MDYIIVNFLNGLLGKVFILDVLGIIFADFIIFAFPVLVIVSYLLKRKKIIPIIVKIAVAISLAGFLNFIISEIIQRLRPFVIYDSITQYSNFFYISSNDFSFPSDHTTFAFIIAFLVWFEWKNFGKVLILLSFLIGLSRVFIGVHFLTDIIGGCLIAFLIVNIVKRILIFKNR